MLLLLNFEVGTFPLREEDMDERAEGSTLGNNISSTLGAEFPGIMNICSSRTFVGPVVLVSLLEILLSAERFDKRASSRRCGWCELPIS